MASYPSIQDPNGLVEKIIKAVHVEESEAGYLLSRARASISKKEFEIHYNVLTSSERDTLQTFFNSNQGSSFSWTHPETGGSTYDVVFIEDELEFKWILGDYWSLDLKIREV